MRVFLQVKADEEQVLIIHNPPQVAKKLERPLTAKVADVRSQK